MLWHSQRSLESVLLTFLDVCFVSFEGFSKMALNYCLWPLGGDQEAKKLPVLKGRFGLSQWLLHIQRICAYL